MIAISDAIARVLESDGIDPHRIVVVHSGVDLAEAATAAPLGLRNRLGLAEGSPLAVNVGALVPHKDHATLLRAAALLREPLPRLHWAIAGEGPLADGPGGAAATSSGCGTVCTFWDMSPNHSAS